MPRFVSSVCLPLGVAMMVLSGCHSAPLPASLGLPLAAIQKTDYEPQRLSAEALRARQLGGEPLVIVDVREPTNFNDEHIEGALNLPWAQIQSGGYPPLPKDRLIALYCT